RLSRNAETAWSRSCGMASSTGEGSGLRAWQADPVAAAMAGVAASRSSPRTPMMLTCRVPGRRRAGCPVSRTRPGRFGQAPIEQVPRSVRRLVPVPCQFAVGEVGGGAQADRQGDVLGAGPQAAFLPATRDEGFEEHPGSDVEGAHALGRVHLVADRGEQVDAETP